MAETRITQIDLGAIGENEDANDLITQIDLGAMAINENADARVTEIVFLAITASGNFRELFSPVTSHDD